MSIRLLKKELYEIWQCLVCQYLKVDNYCLYYICSYELFIIAECLLRYKNWRHALYNGIIKFVKSGFMDFKLDTQTLF